MLLKTDSIIILQLFQIIKYYFLIKNVLYITARTSGTQLLQ